MTLAIPRLDRSTAAERGLTIGDFLVPVAIAERLGTRVRHVILIALGAAVMALSAQIVIPTQPVPFTGQTLGVLLVGGALGLRRGGTEQPGIAARRSRRAEGPDHRSSPLSDRRGDGRSATKRAERPRRRSSPWPGPRPGTGSSPR